MIDGTVIQPDTDVISEMAVYDTRTWQLVQQIEFDRPIKTITVDSGRGVVYAVVRPLPNVLQAEPHVFGGNTIVAFDVATGQVRAEHKREDEEIIHLFMGP